MGLVWVACAILLDVNASYGPCHPTISRCWLRRANTLSLQEHGTPLVLLTLSRNFLESVLSPPLSLFSASQQTRGVCPSFVCSHAVPHVSENARRPTKPAHLSPRRVGDEKQIQ